MEPNIKMTATSKLGEDSAISKLAYKKFQLRWMMDHGYGVDDLLQFAQDWAIRLDEDAACPQDYPVAEELEESGLGAGSLWPCYEEFFGAEYQDAALIKSLLDEKEYIEYLEDIGRLRICRLSDQPDENAPCVERWNTVDGLLYNPGDIEEIRPDELPDKLQWLHTCGFCGNNLYLCSYNGCYGVAVVYEYPESEARERGISMDKLFSCAIADAVQMASCDAAEGVQIIVAERSSEPLGHHEVVAFIPAAFPADAIRSAIQTFDCYAFKANYSGEHLYIGNTSAKAERIFVTTPAGAISAYRVGGNEYPGVAVDFFPNGADDYSSVVVEYGGSTVKARFHRDSNSEPILSFNMGANI